MAEVWKARVAGVGGFEKILVVKKILPAFASNKTFIEMLLAEARLCAVLQHTNIVQTYENGEIDGQYYIAMEYVPGYDLFKVLSRATQVGRRLPIELCLFVAAEVAKGLAYAHNAKDHRGRPLNIIHRDVSPSNVLISEAGEVKVMDFGVARATMGGAKRDGQSRAGVLKGKLGYMSPEQVTGQQFDHRSDVFSLGIILYESITLKRLFLGRTDLETLVNIRDARIEHKFRKHSYIEEAVRAILRMALSRSNDERYDSALDLHDDIVNLLFEWKIQVTNRSLAAFLAELFDETGQPAEPRRRKSALGSVGQPGEADSVAFSPEEVQRQAAAIKRRRDQQRQSERISDDHGNRSAATTMRHERADLGSVDEADGVQAPTAATGVAAPAALDPALVVPTRAALAGDDAIRRGLLETFEDSAPPDFDVQKDFTRPDIDAEPEKPRPLSESRLRPIPLSADAARRPSDSEATGAAGEAGGPYVVFGPDGESLGPMQRGNIEAMIRARSIGPGVRVKVDGRAPRPLEEITELRGLLAEIVPDRAPAKRSGRLSRLNFPRLIFDLYIDRVSGCLEMRADDAAKFIYFRRGRPQHVVSNQKSEMLGEFLLAQGLITQRDIDEAVLHIEKTGGRLGDALVGLNTIKPFQLYQVLEKQFRAKFIDAFGWDGAEFQFYDGDTAPADVVPLDIDPVSALAEGVRAKLTYSLLEPYFEPDLDRRYYRARDPRISVEALRFQARETKALSALMSSQSLREVLEDKCRNRQQRLATMHVAFLMLQTELLTFEAVA